MGFGTILVIILLIFTLYPYILTLILRLLFRRYLKSIQVLSYSSFKNIHISISQTLVKIDKVSFSITSSKFLILIKGVTGTLTPALPPPSQSSPPSVIKSIILRLLLSIFSKFFIFKLQDLNLSINQTTLTLSKLILYLDLSEPSGAIDTTLMVSKFSASSSEFYLKLSSLELKHSLPGIISLVAAYEASTVEVVIGKIGFRMISLPVGSESEPQPAPKMMKNVKVKVFEAEIEVLTLVTAVFDLEFELLPMRFRAGLITGKGFSNPAIHIPNLRVNEGEDGVLRIRSEYVGCSVSDLCPVIFKLMGIKGPKMEKKNRTKVVDLQIDLVEARLPSVQNTVIEVSNLQLYLHNAVELSITSVVIQNVLGMIGFKLQVSETVEVSLKSIDLRLNEVYLREFVSCIATLYRENFSLSSISEEPSPKKTVNLAFDTISVYGHYSDDFKIFITVEKFTANINPKSFNLFFFNSNIYDMETEKHHVVYTSICRVNKFYKEHIANISVTGEDIAIYLPRNYYLARAVIKFIKNSHKVYKWSKFAFLQVQKSYTYIPERATLELRFNTFKFVAKDDEIDFVQIKKNHINPSEDVLEQMKGFRLVNSLLTLTCSSAFVKLNNFELDTMEKLRMAVEELDEFEMPYNDFFAVILAYDFTCIGKKIVMNIRDYPFDFCKIRIVKFGGRSILTKNRILIPVWAQYKHHSTIEVSCTDVSLVFGICLLKVFIDLFHIVKYLFLLRSSTSAGIKKLDIIDFFRYFLHGSMKVSVTGLRTMILRTPSPYQFEYFNFDIAGCDIEAFGDFSKVTCTDLVFYIEDTCIMNLPNTVIKLSYEILCKNSNHWISSNNVMDKIEDFISESINLELQASILQSDKKFSVYYHLVDSDIIDGFIKLHSNPPVYLLPNQQKSYGRLLQHLKKIVIKEIKVYNLDVFLIINVEELGFTENLAACLTIPSIHLSAECTVQQGNSLVPFIVNSANGTCCNMILIRCPTSETDSKTLLKCVSIEYTFSNTESHAVVIEDFQAFICTFFINLLTELVVSQPVSMKNLIKKKRVKTKKFGIKQKKTTSHLIIKGKIINPVISILSEEDEARIVIKGGQGEFEISEENLKFDTLHRDSKKRVKFVMQTIECFVDQHDNTLSVSKIFDSKDIGLNLKYFMLPFNEIDYARNCVAADEYLWYKEKRVNRLEIVLPGLSSSIESEDFWVLIDIIKGYIGFIPKHQVSFSERMMEDEFKMYGGRELIRLFSENMKKTVTNKPSESKVLEISLSHLNVTLKKSSANIIELNLFGFKFNISTFTDNSCQKSLEIHKITMNSGNTIMISPLLLEHEEYLQSSTMVKLGILDRWVKGSEVFWPVVDHLEVFVLPLNINFSKEIYKELYAYFFNEEKEKSKGKQMRIKLPRLYKYIHLNEFKICITVTGWIPLNKSKITLKAFTRQNKFKTLQGVFDKIMKHELKSMIAQVPSICIQNLGISKKNFLPTTEMPQRTNSFFDKLKRNKSQKAMTELDLQKKEGIKLLFGKDFK